MKNDQTTTCNDHPLISDLIFLIDSREPDPYHFGDDQPVKIEHLKTGDYSVEGLERQLAIERKTKNDLVQSLVHNWDSRFRDCVSRMRAINKAGGYAAIVAECSLGEIVNGDYTSSAEWSAVVGRIVSIIIDFGVMIHFCDDRQVACYMTGRLLENNARRIRIKNRKESELFVHGLPI